MTAWARICLLMLAAAGLTSGCAPGSGGQDGAQLPDGRPRVMSMNPCIDAILLEVADAEQILSLSHFSRDERASSTNPERARRFPANYETAEEAVAVRPDLLLLGPHVAPATVAALENADIRSLSVNVASTIAESRAQVLTVARAVGQEERGRALLARIDAALRAAAPGAGEARIPALIRMSGGLVPGAGTLAGELLGRAGFEDMSARYDLRPWDMLPLERMVASPPALLLTDKPDARVPPGVRVADFPQRMLFCAGPTLIEAAGRLAAIRRAMAGA